MLSARDANSHAAALSQHAEAIRALGKRAIADIIEIGRRLIDAKGRCGHGNRLPWLDREFGWDERTAQRFMGVGAKGDKLSDLNVPVSALYLLAASSTPAEVIAQVAERSQRGEQVTVAQVRGSVTARNEAEVHRVTAPPRSSTPSEPERLVSIVRSSSPTVTTHVTLSRDVGEALSLVVAMETCAISDAKMAELVRAATELGRNREALRRVAQAIIDTLDGGRPVRSLNSEETVH